MISSECILGYEMATDVVLGSQDALALSLSAGWHGQSPLAFACSGPVADPALSLTFQIRSHDQNFYKKLTFPQQAGDSSSLPHCWLVLGCILRAHQTRPSHCAFPGHVMAGLAKIRGWG